MGATNHTTPSERLRERLQQADPPVGYDTAQGLARHRALVAAKTALPAWSNEQPSGMSRGMRRALWGGGMLLLAGAAWLMLASPETRPALSVLGSHAEPRAATLRSHAEQHASTSPASRAQASQAESSHAVPRTGPAAATPPPAADARIPAELQQIGPMQAEPPPAQTSGPSPVSASPPKAPTPTAEHADAPPTRVRRNSAPPGKARTPATVQTASNEQTATRKQTARDAQSSGDRATATRLVEAPRDNEEMREVSLAEQLLDTDPERALRLVRAGNKRFQHGYFVHERHYLEIVALFSLGRNGEGQAYAQWFLRDYPVSPYRQKIERLVTRSRLP